jgi:hypothetical protein
MMLFDLGTIVITDGAAALLAETGQADAAARLMRRHLTGDWGELDEHDRAVNRENLRRGWRLMSAYTLPGGQRIWIITEQGVTTILLPEEY